MKRAHRISVAVLSVGVWLAGQARADSATPPCLGEACTVAAANRCAAAKVVASGTYMEDVLGCSALSGLGGSAEKNCRRWAEGKLVATFAVLERTGACKTTGDAHATAVRIDSSVVNLVAMLGNRRSPLCTAYQLTAMGADVNRQNDCYAAAVAKVPGTRWTASVSRRRPIASCGTSHGQGISVRPGMRMAPPSMPAFAPPSAATARRSRCR